jgi:E3 ubiquitin-protein ligase RNF31
MFEMIYYLDCALLQYADLLSRGNFTREDIVTVLTANHGNIEAAYLELSKTQLKPFLMRIWGPPNGTENESGNINAENTEVNTNEIPDAVAQKHPDEEGNHQVIMI